MKRKKWIIIAIAAVAVVATGLWFVFGRSAAGSGAEEVYVERIGDMMGYTASVPGIYSGKVESQETLEIKKDPEKEVKEILVQVGDLVTKDTPLFVYDTESIAMQKQQAELEAESIENDISNYNSQITELRSEKAKASSDQQLEYTMQIQTLETSIKQAEYDRKQKNVEIENYQKAIDHATVRSSIDGVIKEINETTAYDNYGNEMPFMTVLATGDYRVRGVIDEQSLYFSGLSEGQKVTVRSRVDESITWSGTISKIDTENEYKEEQSMYYYEDNGGESATKYPFYIELDDSEGLLMGQHVYIEPSNAESQVEGIWLDESYIMDQDGKSCVWIDKKGKLKLQEVELGDYSEDSFSYQILSGLTEDDYIAWPMEEHHEGMKTISVDSFAIDDAEVLE